MRNVLNVAFSNFGDLYSFSFFFCAQLYEGRLCGALDALVPVIVFIVRESEKLFMCQTSRSSKSAKILVSQESFFCHCLEVVI